MRSPPSLLETFDARSGATAASAVPIRSSSGATVTSPRSRSTAETVASATRSGETVRKPGGSSAPLSANIPASCTKPGETIETPTPVPRRSARRDGAEPAQAELRRRVERAARDRRAARQRRHEDEVPGAALAHRRHVQPRQHDRRAEVHVEHPVDLLLREGLQPPGAGHRRVRDDDVDVRVRLGQRADGVRVRQIGRRHDGVRDRRRERLEDVGSPAAEHEPRARAPRTPGRSRARGHRSPR